MLQEMARTKQTARTGVGSGKFAATVPARQQSKPLPWESQPRMWHMLSAKPPGIIEFHLLERTHKDEQEKDIRGLRV